MRKRERARQQAEELRKMQKLFLLKAMSSPGEQDLRFLYLILLTSSSGKMVAEQPDLCGDGQTGQNKATSRLHTTTSKLSRIL